MKVQKAKNALRKTNNLVHKVQKPVNVGGKNNSSDPFVNGELINPYAPFIGMDGKTYFKLSYPSELNQFTNCYAFALGIRAKGEPGKDYYPGFLSGFPLSKNMYNNLEERVRADLTALGRTVFEIIYANKIPKHLPKAEKGSVWIKVYKTPIEDGGIHFAVKHEESGRWIHKIGWVVPPKVVVRHIEGKTAIDAFFEENPELKKEDYLNDELFDLIFEANKDVYIVTKSKLEDEDDASFWVYPEGKYLLKEYVPLWVMRVSE